MVTDRQRLEFKARLKERFCDLREEIRLELLQSDNEHFIDLAGQVHDLEEESVADLLVDIDLAIVDLHVEEIRAIDRALMRIAEGEFGICAGCGTEIDVERLEVNPTATRCTDCQAAYEREHAGQHPRTI